MYESLTILMRTNIPRLTESPETIRIGKTTADFEHPTAWAFSIINDNVVGVSGRTHPYIFNAIRAVASPEAAWGILPGDHGKRPQSVYSDYGVKFAPHIPNDADLAWFRKIYTGDMGGLRERTKSGRVWKSIKIEGDTVAAVSFWARRKHVNDADIELLVRSLKLKEPIYVEFIDSKQAELYKAGATHATKELRSKIHPTFDSKRIIDILVRAHVSPMSITPEEQDIVGEFRGKPDAPVTVPPDDMTAAERNFRRTIGDSTITAAISEGLGSYTAPTDAKKLFWDFYCLYTLAFKYGDLYNHYYPNQGGQEIVNFRIAECVNEAFFSVKERVKGLIIKHIPLVALDEALNINYTQEFDLEALYLWLLTNAGSNWNKRAPLAELVPVMLAYVEQKAPGVGDRVSKFLAGLLALVMRNSHITSQTVTCTPEFITDTELGAFLQSRGGRVEMNALESVFTLHWDDGYGGHKWFEICELWRKLKASKTIKNEVFYIDRFYDIEHNTGALLDKVPALWVPKADLNARFLVRDPREFIPHVSADCRKLTVAVTRVVGA